MSGAIIQLQRDAVEATPEVSELLRRAFAIARKLGLKDFEQWTRLELNGYPPGSELPDYRILHGQPKGTHPYYGWVPIIFHDPTLAKAASEVRTRSAVTDIEAMLKEDAAHGVFMMPWSARNSNLLREHNPGMAEAITQVSRGQMAGIIGRIRNAILEWALQLEADGIVGEGLAFTVDEKVRASAANYSVSNFFGTANIAQVSSIADQATFHLHVAAADIDAIGGLVRDAMGALDEIKLLPGDRAEVRAELKTLEAQAESPKPKPGIVRAALEGLVKGLSGAAGHELAGPLIHRAQEILRHFTG